MRPNDTEQDMPTLPPQSHEAEQAVLGALLLQGDALNTAIEHLMPADFYRSSHQHIFRIMCRLADRGDAIDNVTVAEELVKDHLLEETGGRAYLAELVAGIASTSNLVSHCRVVRERSRERQLRNLCFDSIERIGREPIAELMEDVERNVYALNQGIQPIRSKAIGELVQERLSYLQELYSGRATITGVSTGFRGLDAVTAGLHPGNLVIVGGRPGMGKSDFALNMAVHVALSGQPVLFFSLEMSKEQLTDRILSDQASVDGHTLHTGQIDSNGWRRLAEATSRIESTPLTIDDSGSLSIPQLRSRCRLHKSRHGLGLVVIDYLQLMQGRTDAATREQEVSELSRSLKTLAKELSIPIVALSQLNRSVEARKPPKPKLADLRESGGIEQDADVVLMLYREEYYNEESERKGLADVLIEKQRNGALTEIQLIFQGKFSRFLDMPSDRQEGHT